MKKPNEKVRKFFDEYAAKFDALYGEDVRANLFNRIFRASVYERFRLAATDAERLCEGFSVLDVGTGPGRYLSLMAPKAGRLVGVDLSDGMLGPARARAELEGYTDKLELLAGDFLNVDFGEEFDLILAFGYFDYVFEPAAHFRRMNDLCRGILLATFPKRWHPLTLQRKIRYTLNRCPVRFYSLSNVNGYIATTDYAEADVIDIGREYYVRMNKGVY